MPKHLDERYLEILRRRGGGDITNAPSLMAEDCADGDFGQDRVLYEMGPTGILRGFAERFPAGPQRDALAETVQMIAAARARKGFKKEGAKRIARLLDEQCCPISEILEKNGLHADEGTMHQFQQNAHSILDILYQTPKSRSSAWFGGRH